jgi:hypothetical protein
VLSKDVEGDVHFEGGKGRKGEGGPRRGCETVRRVQLETLAIVAEFLVVAGAGCTSCGGRFVGNRLRTEKGQRFHVGRGWHGLYRMLGKDVEHATYPCPSSMLFRRCLPSTVERLEKLVGGSGTG